MYTIREATLNDVETIRQLADAIWWPTYAHLLAKEQIEYMLAEIYSTEKITEQIGQQTQTFLLLVEDGQPVAFAGYSPYEGSPETYKLHKIYCLPATQGKGYGKVLINAVADKVLSAGKKVLELNVQRHNRARAFYEKMGFVIAYEIDIPFGPYMLTDYVMRKEL